MADQNVTVALTAQDNLTKVLREAATLSTKLHRSMSSLGGGTGAAAASTRSLGAAMGAAGLAAASTSKGLTSTSKAAQGLTANTGKLGTSLSSASKSSRGLHTSLVGLGGGVTNLRAAFAGLNPLTASLAVGFSTMVATLSSFGREMSWVDVAAADTREELTSLRKAALDLGDGSLGYGPTQAATAIAELGKAGVETEQILNGGLKGALSLAASGQIDVAEASEVAASAMNQFGLSGAAIPHIADLLSAGAAKAQGSVHDLSLGMRQSSLVANLAGLTIEETSAAMAAFASNGLIGSDAGTSFKTMLLMLTPTTVAAKNKMDELNISAFDAQGEFVGLADYAGQLKTALAGMSFKEQQEALKTMFGQDAIRAASILFEQGSEGITDWTDKVTDAGHASRTAAGLMDNLSGDVKKLWASFQSTTIEQGSGLNDVLRGMTQSATAMLSSLKDVPAGAIAAGVGLTALVAVSGRLREANAATAASFATAAAAAKAYGASLATAGGLAGPKVFSVDSSGMTTQVRAATLGMSGWARSMNVVKAAAGGLRTVGSGLFGLMGGPWGLALSVGAIALGKWAQSQAEAAAATERTKDQLSTLTSTLEDSTGKVTEETRKTLAQMAIDDDALKSWKDFGIEAGTISNAVLGQAGATKTLNDQLDQQKARLEGIVTEWTQYTEGGLVVFGEGEQAQRDLERLEALRAKVGELTGGLKDGQQAVKDVAKEQEAAAKSTEGLTDKARLAKEATKAAADATEKWDAALKALNATFDREAALDQYNQGLLKLNENLDKNSDKLTGNTQGALTNREAMRSQVDAGLAYLQTLRDAGASNEAIAKASKTLADGLDTTAQKAGISKTEVKKYSDVLRKVPKTATTEVKADTAQARANIAGVQAALNALKVTFANVNQLSANTRAPWYAGSATPNANGGIATPRADGGFASNGTPVPRVPQVGSKSNRYILWNEPETEREAYISDKPGMRARNLAVAREAVSWFGMDLIPKAALSQFANGGLAGKFVSLLKSQIGDSYKWGAGHYAKFRREANPSAYDCSSFVHWGLGRTIGRDVMNATAGMRGSGLYSTISLAKAIATPGAVLWKPGHTAASDGTGKTIEAMNKDRGVTVGNAKGRFTLGLWPKAFGSIDEATKNSGDTGSTSTGTTGSTTTPFSTSIKATAADTKARSAFAANVSKIANAGYGDLASSLLSANDDQAWVNAAALAKLSPAKLRSAAGTYANADKVAAALTNLSKAWAATTATKTTLASVAASKAFLANVKTIAARGYKTLAATMIEGGEETYGAIAAELAKDTTGVKLRAYAGADSAATAVKKQLDDLAATLKGLKTISLSVGQSTVTDPTVRWLPAPAGTYSGGAASVAGGPSISAPLVNIDALYAFDDAKFVAGVTAPLGDALALSGIGAYLR